MMAPTLYMVPQSPPVRAVLICAKHLNLELDLKVIDMQNGANHTPKYLKLNPNHTVPVLVDDKVVIADSHAIMIYLVTKYGKGQESLYPGTDELEKHLAVHQLMHFENGSCFQNGRAIVASLRKGNKTIPQSNIDHLIDNCKVLDKTLEGRKYAIGDQLTIADFSLIATLTSIIGAFIDNFDYTQYKNLNAWMNTIKALLAYQAQVQGLDMLIEMIASLRK